MSHRPITDVYRICEAHKLAIICQLYADVKFSLDVVSCIYTTGCPYKFIDVVNRPLRVYRGSVVALRLCSGCWSAIIRMRLR